MNKKTIYLICSYSSVNTFDIKVTPDVHAKEDVVYIMQDGISLEDYAQEWKNKVQELEKRYSYLERGREWAIKNFRGLLK